MRTPLFYLMLVVSSLVHGLTSIVVALLGVTNRRVHDWSVRGWAKWILAAAGTRVEVWGLERVPRDGPVVYASNHSSMFDIWALAAALPGSVRFVAKAELARIPFFGRAMLVQGHVAIDRFNKLRAFEAYERAAATIRSGISTIVFPEGTRSRTGELLPFKNAPFGLAIAAQVPLVPVYVHHTFEILPKGKWRIHRRPIQVRIGEPIPTGGMTLDDREALRNLARATLVDLQARVDAGPAAR
ncbi:MAG: 1-acyl-sn-glycerol-3-phosphate acyltransferase [Gemmatimonadetes bacterium]|nr:1-acyl-sn-glycerol-3-phosphate acyltransferase [Gemmatimonadota bacterium]